MLCFEAKTDKSKKIRNYYITIERISFEYIKKQMIKQTEIISENQKLIQLQTKQLEEKENELTNIKNKTYEEINKHESIYIYTTDKDFIYKVGKTKDVIRRKQQLQTACVDSIDTLYEYKTSSYSTLETIIHDILKPYRTSKREHFHCNVPYIKSIITISGIFLDTLKSSFEYISSNELLEKLYNKLKHDPIINKPIIQNQLTLTTNEVLNNNTNIKIPNTNIITNNNIQNQDIIYNWILKNYTKTNNIKCNVKLKDIYDFYQKDIIFKKIIELQNLKLTYRQFTTHIQSCTHLKEYFKCNSNKANILICFIKK